MKKYAHLTDNSRDVMPGGLFISMPAAGAQQYIDDAALRGASAVILPMGAELSVPAGVESIYSANIAVDAARLAAEYYPRTPPHVCAITGTKGKTSIVSFIVQILKILGKSAASIGTLGVVSDKFNIVGENTTSRIIQTRQWMERLAADGVEYLALEASSHGIEQRRLEFIKFDAVGFSNLSRDHLDYHKTMDDYFAAKARLFTDFEYHTAVINADDEWAMQIPARGHVIHVGRNGKDIKILDIKPTHDGQTVELEYFGTRQTLKTPLIGEFQVYNLIMALGLVIGMRINANALPIPQIFSKLRAPAGRAEFIGKTKTGAAVYVDYAHTPASLEQIITSLRAHIVPPATLHVVFGCGGDRDAGKRPMMGEIASRLADVVIVTDDNPRTEDAALVRAQIMARAPGATEIADRAAAIRAAIAGLRDGDILIIAGKGHEDYQIIGKTKHHFSDAEEVRKWLV